MKDGEIKHEIEQSNGTKRYQIKYETQEIVQKQEEPKQNLQNKNRYGKQKINKREDRSKKKRRDMKYGKIERKRKK